MSTIRLEEGPPPHCPECFGSDIDSLGVCDCGACLGCHDARKRGYPEATVCSRHATEPDLSDFYGSSTPQTDRERHEVALREKRAVGR